MTITTRIGLFLCLGWLTACTTTNFAPAPVNNKVGWDARASALAQVHNWNLKGIIAIRTAKGSDTASFNWQQNNQTYTLSLFGPLGTNAFKLAGKPGAVTLSNTHGQTFYAKTPEDLLEKQTGWRLPVSNLVYWVRGLPAPGTAVKKLDAYNHLIELQQNGWHIEFLRYTAVNKQDLPNKIFITSPNLKVKIIISHWEI